MGYSNNKDLFKPFKITSNEDTLSIASMDFNGTPLIELEIPKTELLQILENDVESTSTNAAKILKNKIKEEQDGSED